MLPIRSTIPKTTQTYPNPTEHFHSTKLDQLSSECGMRMRRPDRETVQGERLPMGDRVTRDDAVLIRMRVHDELSETMQDEIWTGLQMHDERRKTMHERDNEGRTWTRDNEGRIALSAR